MFMALIEAWPLGWCVNVEGYKGRIVVARCKNAFPLTDFEVDMNKIGTIDTSQIQAMLQQLRAVAAQTQAPVRSAEPAEQAAAPVDFSNVLKASLDKVSETQQAASQLSDRFTKGDDSVSLSEVMIAGQKANISLQATIQVRSKLVAAYNDIMNMQV
jgi:flagellar hook-basal body complex protein FliE